MAYLLYMSVRKCMNHTVTNVTNLDFTFFFAEITGRLKYGCLLQTYSVHYMLICLHPKYWILLIPLTYLFLHSPSSPFHLGLSFKHYLVALSTRWGNHLLCSGTQDYPAIASTAQGQSRRDTHHSTFDWLPPKEPTNLHIQCIENITFWIHTWVITEAELSMVLILWFCHVLKQVLIITLQ